jgi:predicted transposase YbfD/YdcC
VADTGHASDEAGHGRAEERYVTVIADPAGVPADWPDVAAVVQVNRERTAGGKTTSSTHYYLTSHRGTAAELAGLIRGHWGIESMHWVLDVVYREDDRRVRAGHAGVNLAMIRKVAVSLTRRAPGKGSGVTKRLKAGWDDEFLVQVLQGVPAIVVR